MAVRLCKIVGINLILSSFKADAPARAQTGTGTAVQGTGGRAEYPVVFLEEPLAYEWMC